MITLYFTHSSPKGFSDNTAYIKFCIEGNSINTYLVTTDGEEISNCFSFERALDYLNKGYFRTVSEAVAKSLVKVKTVNVTVIGVPESSYRDFEKLVKSKYDVSLVRSHPIKLKVGDFFTLKEPPVGQDRSWVGNRLCVDKIEEDVVWFTDHSYSPPLKCKFGYKIDPNRIIKLS